MPQEFQVIRCCACDKFQVHQTKKAKKWQCKVCGEKQSLIKAFFIGSARDCRMQVQQFNFQDGQKKLDSMLKENNSFDEWSAFELQGTEEVTGNKHSDWSNDSFLQNSGNPCHDESFQESSREDIPRKRQRCDSYSATGDENKSVLNHLLQTPDIEVNKQETSQVTSPENMGISFDVMFGPLSVASEAALSKNDKTFKIEDSGTNSKFLHRPKQFIPKNRGFQLILNAAKKLS